MQVTLASNNVSDTVAITVMFQRFSTGTTVFTCLIGVLHLLAAVIGLFRELAFALNESCYRRQTPRTNRPTGVQDEHAESKVR